MQRLLKISSSSRGVRSLTSSLHFSRHPLHMQSRAEINSDSLMSSFARPCPSFNRPSRVLSGRGLASLVYGKIQSHLIRLGQGNDSSVRGINQRPFLACVLVGNNQDSHRYVSLKKKACMGVGALSESYELPASVTQAQLEAVVQDLNADPRVSGIIVQFPLPPHLDEARVSSLISVEKDVDGLHPLNVMQLAATPHLPLFVPCAAKAALFMAEKCLGRISGKSAVVLGDTQLVGRPTAHLLRGQGADVTVCHKDAGDADYYTRRADIVVVDVETPCYLDGSKIRPGAVVIDAGMNVIGEQEGTAGKKKIAGDVDFQSVLERAGYISPVPGGLGPLTIAMLVENTFLAWLRSNGYY